MMEILEDYELEKSLAINIFNRMIIQDPMAWDVLNFVSMNNFRNNETIFCLLARLFLKNRSANERSSYTCGIHDTSRSIFANFIG